MKTFIAIVILLAFLCPVAVGHGSMMYPDRVRHDSGMMRTIEFHTMDNATHGEMEDLMYGMIEGNLTPNEQEHLVELMEENPGGYSTMLYRLTQETMYGDDHFWEGMPGYGMMGVLMLIGIILGGLFFLVWLIVGILLIVRLLRQISGG
jgi:hypothetical protein